MPLGIWLARLRVTGGTNSLRLIVTAKVVVEPRRGLVELQGDRSALAVEKGRRNVGIGDSAPEVIGVGPFDDREIDVAGGGRPDVRYCDLVRENTFGLTKGD